MLRRLTVGFLTVLVLVLAWFCIAIWPPITPDGRSLSPGTNLVRALIYGGASALILGAVVRRRAIRERLSERARLATAVATYRERR